MTPSLALAVTDRIEVFASTRRPYELAKRYIRQRRVRADAFGADLFRDPAWDIVLDLYCSRTSGKLVGVMDACIAAGVPLTTAHRHVRRLLDATLIVTRRDPHDRRRSWLELTDAAAKLVEIWLERTWPECP